MRRLTSSRSTAGSRADRGRAEHEAAVASPRTSDLWIIPSAVLYFWAQPPARAGRGCRSAMPAAATGRRCRACLRMGGRAHTARRLREPANASRARPCDTATVYIPRPSRGAAREAAGSPGRSRARTAAASIMPQAAAVALCAFMAQRRLAGRFAVLVLLAVAERREYWFRSTAGCPRAGHPARR